MKKIALLCLSLLSVHLLYSATSSYQDLDFGQYLNEEFSFNRLESDTLAEAVFLFDIGRSYFEFDTETGNTYLHFTRRFKIKILSKAGFDWANVEIPLRKSGGKSDELQVVNALTYTMENGLVRKTRLDKRSVFKEDRNRYFTVMKFAMPDVQVGSVIEVQYSVKSPFMFFFKNWEFQKSIPVLHSEYTAAMVPFFNYSYLLQGRNKFDEQFTTQSLGERTIGGIKFRDLQYTFVMKNLAAFRSEPFITCPDDYVIKLNFQLCEYISPECNKTNYLTTWPKFCNNMMSEEFFGGRIKDAESKSKGLLKGVTLPDSAVARARTVYDWVVSSMHWNGDYDKYSDTKVSTLLKSRTGSTADINLLLIGMLRGAGLEAFPVMVSTRDHGKFKVDYPFDFFFNYVIAAVWADGRLHYLDATEPTIGFGNVPSRCINEKGFLIKNKKEFDWVSLNEGKVSMESYTIQLEPVPGADSTDCRVQLRANGHYAMAYRSEYQSDRNDLSKSFLGPDLSLTEPYVLTNEQKPDLPFKVEFKAKARQLGEDGVIWVKPFMGLAGMGTPFKNPTREYPIDLIYRQGKRFFVTVKIPDGYELAPMQQLSTIDDENFRMTFEASMEGTNTLAIRASYEFKKDVYGASTYERMKNYFRQMDQVFNQSISVVRKTQGQRI